MARSISLCGLGAVPRAGCVSAGDAIFRREHLAHDLDEFGIGEVEQPAVAGNPLIGMEQARDLPFAVEALEAILIPAILGIFRGAAVRCLPVTCNHIDDRVGAIAVNGCREIGVLMVPPHRT
jgi:hypothetical protein